MSSGSPAGRLLVLALLRSYGCSPAAVSAAQPTRNAGTGRTAMRRVLLIVGLLALAMGLLWIGQGTGVVAWPKTSFMINQLQWAGYGAALAAVGLILIWQSQR